MTKAVRRILFALLLVAPVPKSGLGEPLASDPYPSRDARQFASITRVLRAGDEVFFGCQQSSIGPYGAEFEVFRLTESDGVRASSALVGVSRSMVGASAVAGPIRVSKGLGSEGLGWGKDGNRTQATEDGAIVEAAWASWGSTIQNCALYVNDVEIAPTTHPGSRATFRLPSDFSGGVGLSGSVVSGVNAAILQEFEWASDGTIVSWLGPLYEGWVEVELPDGSVRGEPRYGDVFVFERMPGRWEYRAPLAISEYGFPLLFLMNIPD